MYECAGSIAHEVAKGGAVVNEAGDVCVDATAFGKADIKHIQVGAWVKGLYMSKVSVYEVYRRVR